MKITYKNKIYEVEKNTTLEEFIKNYNIENDFKDLIILGLINNNLRELSYKLNENTTIDFIDLKDKDGRKTYMNSLSFLFLVALKIIDPQVDCKIEHSLNDGFYIEINKKELINREYVNKIQNKMNELVNLNLPITKIETDIEAAKKIYQKEGHLIKPELLDYKKFKDNIPFYNLLDYKNYFYGYMVTNTKYLKTFNLKLYNGGIVLLGPDVLNPKKVSKFKHEPRLFTVYEDIEKFGNFLNINNVLDLNYAIKNETYHNLIRYNEAYHNKKICDIVDTIIRDNKRIILIAGPSSSGKTSFANKLKIQLIAESKKPISISMDNYFINRADTPVDENGKKNYETLKSLDVEKFNEDLEMLISGYEVKLPEYDFIKGVRKDDANTIPTKIQKDQPIIIEGIHGLNPYLTESISSAYKYKIYVSALTGLNIDNHNSISSTDIRLLRRMIRDKRTRGHSVEATMDMWDSVQKGERENIFVFQENADIMFNSSYLYEISVLKKYVEPLLNKITENSIHFKEAKRLLKFTQYFLSIDDESDIVNTSILREFIGGSKLID